MKLDAALHENHAEIPPSLQVRLISSSFTDPAHQVLHRLHIELVHLKSICVLHRRYLSLERSNLSFAYSRKACGDAALRMLKHQADLHAAIQPGGQFFGDGWMLSSLTLSEFLLASMITCLDLYESYKGSSTTCSEDYMFQLEKYDALRASQGIWASRAAFSRDARRAANMIAVMLTKIPRPNISTSQIKTPQGSRIAFKTSISGDVLAEEAVDPLGSLSDNSSWDSTMLDISREIFPTDNSATLNFGEEDPLNTIFNESDSIDWVSFESFRSIKSTFANL